MLSFLAPVAIFLTGTFALPTGWSAGPSSYFGQPGAATFDYVRRGNLER